MTVASLPPEELRKTVFDLVKECRGKIKDGSVDMSRIESGIRAYCESVLALPEAEGKAHREDLKDLMQLISKLGEELTLERDTVMHEMNNLERMRKANVAYKNSDGIVVSKDESVE